jgi:hypothetical protein
VIIGGIAAGLWGSPTITQDLDICYSREPSNLEKLAAALKELNARLRGVRAQVTFKLDARTLAAGDHFTFATDAGDLDCLGTPTGTSGYEGLKKGAEQMDVDGLKVWVVSLDELIAMKRAAGRAKDRIEVEILAAVREERRRRRRR